MLNLDREHLEPRQSAHCGASRVRSQILAISLVAIWTVIVLRLISVQGFSRIVAERAARRQRTFVENLSARPGDILDRDGRMLATSVLTQSLAIDPSAIDEPGDVARQLALALELDASELTARIAAAGDRQFLWVRRRLSADEAAAVRGLRLPPDVWHFRDEFQRVYPQGLVASHVLGFRDIDNRGRGGLEEGLEHLLLGEDGRRTLIRDARGFVIDVDSSTTVPPRHGQSVRLTIDSVLQASVEQRLDGLMTEVRPQAACAIVLDPRTGEVLAMASRPQRPGLPQAQIPAATIPEQTVSEAEVGGAIAAPPDAGCEFGWRNHAIASMFEPGSTFKPIVVGKALDEGLMQPDEMLDCELGAYRMGRRILHDHHPYGRLSLTDVLVKSSNIGMAKVGERLTNARLFAAATDFGFGRTTGIELPGELPGQLHPLGDWTSYSTGSIPMGQELAATPLQVAAAHAAIANGGNYRSPHLLLAVGGPAAAQPHVVARQVLSAATSRWLVQGPLVEVITRGTGQKAQVKGYTVFGKTGTAQKIDPGGGYSHTRHIGSFVCGAPAGDPRVIVLISVDEPTQGPSQYGGVVAAPAAADILLLALDRMQVPPDVPQELSAGRPLQIATP